jgi:hypothetical protein
MSYQYAPKKVPLTRFAGDEFRSDYMRQLFKRQYQKLIEFSKSLRDPQIMGIQLQNSQDTGDVLSSNQGTSWNWYPETKSKYKDFFGKKFGITNSEVEGLILERIRNSDIIMATVRFLDGRVISYFFE